MLGLETLSRCLVLHRLLSMCLWCWLGFGSWHTMNIRGLDKLLGGLSHDLRLLPSHSGLNSWDISHSLLWSQRHLLTCLRSLSIYY